MNLKSEENPNDWKPTTTRRGPRKGQAVKGLSPELPLADNAMIALLGSEFKEDNFVFYLCLKTAYLEGDPHHLALGKYLAHHIRDRKPDIFDQISRVLRSKQYAVISSQKPTVQSIKIKRMSEKRGAPKYATIVSGGAPLTEILKASPDPLGAIIAAFAATCGDTGVVLTELRNFVEYHYPFAAPVDEDTYKNKCVVMGIKVRRGKPGRPRNLK